MQRTTLITNNKILQDGEQFEQVSSQLQPRQLRRLRRNWQTVANDAGWVPGDPEAALARLEERKDYEPPARIDTFGADVFGTDNSVANGSSITFFSPAV